MTEGLLLRSRLEEHRLRACLALPPADPRLDKVGLDDHLGALGRSLDELEVIRTEVPEDAFARWKARYVLSAKRRDRVQRDAQALRGLILLCGPAGQTTATLRRIARFAGLEPRQAREAVQALVEAGVAWKTQARLSTADRIHLKKGGWVWRPPARVGIREEHRELWACELPRVRLADWLRGEEPVSPRPPKLLPDFEPFLEFVDAVYYEGCSPEEAAERQGVKLESLLRRNELIRIWLVEDPRGFRDLRILDLHSQGFSIAEIARRRKLDRKTVRAVLERDDPALRRALRALQGDGQESDKTTPRRDARARG
jgi:hypothetical protein